MAGVYLMLWLRGQDSNLRPLGYEPNELPLLHPAPIRLCAPTRRAKRRTNAGVLKTCALPTEPCLDNYE